MTHPSQPRVLLLMAPSSYRGASFWEAGRRAGVATIAGVDLPPELAEQWQVPLGMDFRDEATALDQIRAAHATAPFDAIVGVDDRATILAAKAASLLGLPGNGIEAVAATRDKALMRRLFADAGLRTPQAATWPAATDPATIAQDQPYPVVTKPTGMSGSRGVIRADTPEEFVRAFRRTAAIVLAETPPALHSTARVLVEPFWGGPEVAVEGLLRDGNLTVLAIFDKPDPLDGPYFEETIYITPSRLGPDLQDAIRRETAAAAAALGLREGPVHAELRLTDGLPWVIEIAARSIGGLCSAVLQHGLDMPLEEVILRHAVHLALDLDPQPVPAGVMMIPIPRGGLLRSVRGVEEARAVADVLGVEISVGVNNTVVPLPEGASYLGFIFARAQTPERVEAALREAHACLQFDIRPELPVMGNRLTPSP